MWGRGLVRDAVRVYDRAASGTSQRREASGAQRAARTAEKSHRPLAPPPPPLPTPPTPPRPGSHCMQPTQSCDTAHACMDHTAHACMDLCMETPLGRSRPRAPQGTLFGLVLEIWQVRLRWDAAHRASLSEGIHGPYCVHRDSASLYSLCNASGRKLGQVHAHMLMSVQCREHRDRRVALARCGGS